MSINLPDEIEVECDGCGLKIRLTATHEWEDSLEAHIAFVSQDEFMEFGWGSGMDGKVTCPDCAD